MRTFDQNPALTTTTRTPSVPTIFGQEKKNYNTTGLQNRRTHELLQRAKSREPFGKNTTPLAEPHTERPPELDVDRSLLKEFL